MESEDARVGFDTAVETGGNGISDVGLSGGEEGRARETYAPPEESEPAITRTRRLRRVA
jgi:hypothetical protein